MFWRSSWGLSYSKRWARNRTISRHGGEHGLRWPLAEVAQQERNVSAATSLPHREWRHLPQAIFHTPTSSCEMECKWQGWNLKYLKIKLDLFLTSQIRVRWKWIKDLTIRITSIELVWVICCWVTSYSHTEWLKTYAFSSLWETSPSGL